LRFKRNSSRPACRAIRKMRASAGNVKITKRTQFAVKFRHSSANAYPAPPPKGRGTGKRVSGGLVRPVGVVDVPVAGEPALQFAVRVGAAHPVDVAGVRRIDGEFERQLVGARDIEREAIAVVDGAVRDVVRLEPRRDLVEGLLAHLERDVPRTGELGMDRLALFPDLVVGVLEEGERAAIADREEGVAIIDLATE